MKRVNGLDQRLAARVEAAQREEAAWDTPPTTRALVAARAGEVVTLREAPPEGYQGLSWDGPPGGEGLTWRAGREYLEHHPELQPYHARGIGASIGVWPKVALLPPARAARWAVSSVVTSAPWSLQEPAPMPGESAQGAATRARHWAYCQALWARWTAPGRDYPLSAFLEHVIRYAVFESGFYLGEVVPGAPAAIPGVGLAPLCDLPALRRPSSVREWVLSGEEPVGAVQELANYSDSYGVTRAQRVLLPWSRLVHIANDPAGRTDLEGRPILRGAYQILRALEILYQLQPLAVEVNALGTVWVEQDKERPFTRSVDGSGDGELEVLASHLESYKGEHVPYGILPPGGKIARDRASDGVMDFSPIVAWLERQAYLAMGGQSLLVAVQQHGSYAAQTGASADARDSLDHYAGLCARALERALSVCLRLAFPDEAPCVPAAIWTQVEERDNGAYLDQLATYLERVRPKLGPANRRRIDELLDLATDDTAESEAAQLAEGDAPPVPRAVRENARRGLELRREHGRGGTEVGVARARDLSNGRVSLDTVRRMASYFARHEVDKQGEGWGKDSAGYIAWLLWGGDEGWSWARGVLEREDSA